MSFNTEIKKHIAKYDALITNIFQRACEQISIDIAEGSPVSTGTLLGRWEPSVNGAGSNNYQGGPSAWFYNGKDEGIANANRSEAMSDLLPRIAGTVKSLSKKDAYYFTNNTPYIKQAEYDGWNKTGPYHMRTNAIQNWQEIVNSRVHG